MRWFRSWPFLYSSLPRVTPGASHTSGLQIEVYDWDANTAHDLIGTFETTLRQLADAPRGRSEHEVGSALYLPCAKRRLCRAIMR